MKDKRLIISLKPSKHKELKLLAFSQGKTMTFIVQQALREFMLKHANKEEKKGGGGNGKVLLRSL